MKQIAYYILATLSLIGCAASDSSTQSAQEPVTSAADETISFTPQQIEFAGIAASPFIDTVLNSHTNCVGEVELPPQSFASVSVPLGGFVKEIFVLSNQFVKKGQTLATIANPDYIKVQQEYLEFSALTEQLGVEFRRQETLASNEASSVKKMQQAKADYEVAKARLQSAEATLALLEVVPDEVKRNGIRSELPVKSPISGFITELNANIGRYLNPNDVAFELVERTHLHLHLSVYEKDIARIALNDKVEFQLVAFPEKRYQAVIESIGEKVVSDERSVIVIGHINASDVMLKTGMYVNAEIHSNGKRTKALPENALVNSENRWYIFVVENGLFRRVEVTRGVEEGALVEIVNAPSFSPAAQIVQKGAYYIQAEMMKRL